MSIYWPSNTIKKVPKERGIRSNAGLGAQDILFSSYHSIFVRLFRLSCGIMSRLRNLVMILPTISRPIDGLMSLSFWLGLLGYLGHDRLEWRTYVPGWNLRADFSRIRLRV